MIGGWDDGDGQLHRHHISSWDTKDSETMNISSAAHIGMCIDVALQCHFTQLTQIQQLLFAIGNRLPRPHMTVSEI